ncbi:MAG: VWA domain-containing protein [Campylobacterota bacterium]|nr:VWA domain-containing protein [Campylobacterota bacterium]
MSSVLFEYPYLFWVLIIPFVIFAFLISTNRDRLSRLFDEKVLARLSAGSDALPTVVRNIIMFLAIFMMIVAMARPVIERGDKIVEIKGLSLLTALDISGSMRSKDLYPNRLEFAKKKILTLFDTMPSDEIAVVAFAHVSFVLAPFSSDKPTLGQIVERVNDKYINMGSTDFSALGSLAAKMLDNKKPKIMILFSDGGDEKALEGFAQEMKDSGIELYAVLVGTEEGAPVLDSDGKPLARKDGTIAIAQRNDALGQIALDTGGAYVIATNGSEDIKKLVSIIRAKHTDTQQGEVKIKDHIELFYYPLAGAMLLLLIAFSSLPRRGED